MLKNSEENGWLIDFKQIPNKNSINYVHPRNLSLRWNYNSSITWLKRKKKRNKYERDCKCNFKWPSMQRCQFPIYNILLQNIWKFAHGHFYWDIFWFKWNTVRTRKLWNWKTTFRFKLSNEHKTNKLCCVNILISLNTWLDLSHCINIWCETTSNTIDHIINVVFIFCSFLVLTVSIEVF